MIRPLHSELLMIKSLVRVECRLKTVRVAIKSFLGSLAEHANTLTPAPPYHRSRP